MGAQQDAELKKQLTAAKSDKRFFGFAVGKGGDETLLLLHKSKLNRPAVEAAWKKAEKTVDIGKVYLGICRLAAGGSAALGFYLRDPKKGPTTLAKLIRIAMKDVGVSLKAEVNDFNPDWDKEEEPDESQEAWRQEEYFRVTDANRTWAPVLAEVSKQVKMLQSVVRREKVPGAAEAAKSLDKIMSGFDGQLLAALQPTEPKLDDARACVKRYREHFNSSAVAGLIEHAEQNPFGVNVEIHDTIEIALDRVESLIAG